MQLSALTGAIRMEILRDGSFESLGVISHRAPRMLVPLYDSQYLNAVLRNPDVSCVITTGELARRLPESVAVAVCDEPRRAFNQIHEYLCRHTDFYGRDFETVIAPDARVHSSAYIAPRNVRVGARSTIGPNAVVLEKSIVGDDVVIHAGVVVGAEGVAITGPGEDEQEVLHAGGVRLGNAVHVLANAVIQRAAYGRFTEIGEGTKIWPLVNVGHHAQIGRRSRVATGAVICGSAIIGDNVWIGPAVTVSNGVRIGNDARLDIGALVVADVAPGQRVRNPQLPATLPTARPSGQPPGEPTAAAASMEERLKDVVCRTLNLEVQFFHEDLGAGDTAEWDSLGHVKLIAAVEDEFQIGFSQAEKADIETVADLKRLVLKHVAQAGE